MLCSFSKTCILGIPDSVLLNFSLSFLWFLSFFLSFFGPGWGTITDQSTASLQTPAFILISHSLSLPLNLREDLSALQVTVIKSPHEAAALYPKSLSLGTMLAFKCFTVMLNGHQTILTTELCDCGNIAATFQLFHPPFVAKQHRTQLPQSACLFANNLETDESRKMRISYTCIFPSACIFAYVWKRTCVSMQMGVHRSSSICVCACVSVCVWVRGCSEPAVSTACREGAGVTASAASWNENGWESDRQCRGLLCLSQTKHSRERQKYCCYSCNIITTE